MEEIVKLPLIKKSLWLMLNKYMVERNYTTRIIDMKRFIIYKLTDIWTRFMKTVPILNTALFQLSRNSTKPKVCFKNKFTVPGVNVQCNRGGVLRYNVESAILNGGKVNVLCCAKHLDELLTVNTTPKFTNHVMERIEPSDPEEYWVYVF